MSTELAPALLDLPAEDQLGSSAPPRLRQRGWPAWGVFAVARLVDLAVDIPLSQSIFRRHSLQSQGLVREWLHHFLESIEPFGQPAAILFVSLAVYVCGGRRRQSAFRILGSFLLASLACNAVKLCVARVRPVSFFKQHFEFEATVLDTFAGVFRGTGGGTAWQSF